MINKVTLVGRLGADPEVRRLESGAAVARIRLATSESYKDNMGNWQDRTEWHTVIAWRFLAEKVENSLKKGSLVYIEGKLTTRKWQDQNGADRYSTEVVASYLRNLTGKENNGNQGGGFPSEGDDPYAGSNNNSINSTPVSNESTTVSDSADDDLPF